MKVLYLIPGLGSGGGSERSLLTVTPHLVAAGIELTIAYFVVRPNDNAAAYRDAGARVVLLPARSLPGRVREVRRLLRQVRPDVLHTTLFEADQAGRLAAVGMPVRVTFDHYDDDGYEVWLPMFEPDPDAGASDGAGSATGGAR